VQSGNLLFFHPTPQVVKESGAGEKEIGDSYEPFRIIL